MFGLENIKIEYIDTYKCDIETICTELTMAYRDYYYLLYIGDMIKDKKGLFPELHEFIRHLIDIVKNDLILHVYKLGDTKNPDFLSLPKLKNNIAKNWIGPKENLCSFYTISSLDEKMFTFINIRHQKIAHCKSELDRTQVNETIYNAKKLLDEFRKCYNSILLDFKNDMQDLSDDGLKKLEQNCQIGCQLLNKDLLIPIN